MPKEGVILSIEDFEELMEDLEDLAILAERREEPTIPHEDIVADLKRNGYLPEVFDDPVDDGVQAIRDAVSALPQLPADVEDLLHADLGVAVCGQDRLPRSCSLGAIW